MIWRPLHETLLMPVLDSIVVSIPACHAGDWGSIPRLIFLILASLISRKILGDQSPEWQTPIMTKILVMTTN